MRALVYENELRYKSDYPEPEAPPGEAKIRILMAGICDTDLQIIKGYMGFTGVLGHEFVGRVDRVNDPSHEYLIGQRVVGEINCGCGECSWCVGDMARHCPDRTVLGIMRRDGCFSEYMVLPVDNLVPVPDRLRDEEAVFCEPLAAALEITEQVHIQPTERVLVLGDGRLGILSALVLSRTGADVTLAGHHPEKMALVEDSALTVLSQDIQGIFDTVIEATGSPGGRKQALNLVRPRGRLVLKSTMADQNTYDMNAAVVNEITLLGSRCGRFEPALRVLGRNIDVMPLISSVYSLEKGIEAVDKAEGPGSLKVLIDMRS